MCSYCGCDSIPVIGRFMDEHVDIINAAGDLRRAVQARDVSRSRRLAARVGEMLDPHTRAEEVGLFAVMREQDEFTDHIDTLCAEHVTLDALLAKISEGAYDLMDDFTHALRAHIDKEDNGLFPASAIALNGPDWQRVDGLTPVP